MSWVKAMSKSEDVFDEDANDIDLLSKEWESNMKKRIRDGYVDGADAGEEASLQAGFNLGFSEGAAQVEAMGRLKGIVSAVWSWFQIQHPESPVPASVTDLLQKVSQHEDALMENIRKSLENQTPSVSDVSESMEDLDVKQAGSDCSGEGCKEKDCCRGAEKMDTDASHQQRQQPRAGSTDCSSTSSSESLNDLIQRCMDLVSELGLPEGLLSHIQELKNM